MRASTQVALSFGLLAVVAGCEGKIVSSGGDGGGTGATDATPEIDAPGPPPIPADCLEAANRGLAWLVAQQGVDGSWGSNVKVASTGFAVLKLETYAREIGKSPFDPTFVYATQVAKGLDFLFARAQITPIRAQMAGNPDTDGNGNGIQFSTLTYENAIVLMAIAGGGEPDRMVTTAGSPIIGRTYRSVVQDEVDFFAFAQSDSATSSPQSCNRGGWRYGVFDQSNAVGDNSVTQFVTLALEYARHPDYNYQATIPDWVTLELRDWVTCIQNHDGAGQPNDGASGYTNQSNILNAYKTGAIIQQMSFLGDNPNGANPQAAIGYLARTWADTSGIGWRLNPTSDYLAMYSIMKGMESMAITDLGGHNWYREFCDQLKAEQQPDGSWRPSRYERDPMGQAGINSTEWALLVLERAAPPPEIITRQR